MCRLSIIIPAYNSELFIEGCLKSITNQTFTEFEIIVIDDGSVDKTADIINACGLQDPRIKYHFQENQGAGGARNTGLTNACGELITFVDADDYLIDDGVLKRMVDYYENDLNSDKESFIICNCKHFYNKRQSYRNADPYPPNALKDLSKREILYGLTKSGIFLASPCFRLIPRELLIKNNILFPVGNIGEDIYWNIKLLEFSNQVKLYNDYCYVYRKQNYNSASSLLTYNKLFELLITYEKISNEFKNKELNNYVLNGIAYQYIIALGNSVRINVFNKVTIKDKFHKLKWLLGFTDNPKVKKAALIIKLLGLSLSAKILALYIDKKSKINP